MEGISVIVCCYNSALKLPNTLNCLASQKFHNMNLEVIIVDNNSKDNTCNISKNIWKKNNSNKIEFTVIYEPKPGLSFARSAGVKQAKYDLIVFCDDDNWLNEDYCQEAYNIMLSNVNIGILGGLNTAIGEIPLPSWFKNVEQSYACGPQNNNDGEATRGYITGAGMVIRRKIFDLFNDVNFESQLTDRKGDELSSGGDSEICYVSRLLGYKLWYSSKLQLFHFMEKKRLNWNYFIKMILGHAASNYKLQYYVNDYMKPSWFSELRYNIGLLSFKRIFVLFRDFFRFKKNFIGEEGYYHFMILAQLFFFIKDRKNYSNSVIAITNLKSRIAKGSLL